MEPTRVRTPVGKKRSISSAMSKPHKFRLRVLLQQGAGEATFSTAPIAHALAAERAPQCSRISFTW